MTARDETDNDTKQVRQPYVAPVLHAFGSLRDITSSGSTQASLDGGHGSGMTRSSF